MGTQLQDRFATDLVIRGSEDLRIVEADTHRPAGAPAFNADGTLDVVIMRPGAGRGPGQRIFEADMLAANAHKFAGWPMFDNHESPQARRARQGIPRAPSELAGEIREAWWDPEYVDPELDADRGFGRGAVVGRAMLTKPMEDLVRRLPRAVKLSVNAMATKITPGTWRGQRGNVVEGFIDDPADSSVDLVTKAGAGGDVRRVLEAWHDSTENVGLDGPPANRDEVDEMTLAEVLESPEFRAVIEAQVDDVIGERKLLTEDAVGERVAEAVAEQNRTRSLRDRAHERIDGAKGIDDAAKARLKERFAVREAESGLLEPTGALASIAPEMDADGKMVRESALVLDDLLEVAIGRERKAAGDAAPTRVSGQGTQVRESEDEGAPPAGGGGAPGGAEPAWKARQRGMGIDPDKAYTA